MLDSPGFAGGRLLSKRGRRAICTALALLLPAGAAGAGTLRGKVEVLEKDGKRAQDAADAVVWVEGPPPARVRPGGATVTMKSKAFLPRVTVVGVGASVEFPNQDAIFHNVFSVSGDNRFDLQLYKKPKTASKAFEHPGIVRIYCNIHPQMSGFVLVRDNPYWAKVAQDGSYAIPDVPAGTWVLKAWHERAGESAQTVQVKDAGAVEAAFTLDASRFKRAPHKNKFGKDYEVGEKY
jgi:plastocyanin